MLRTDQQEEWHDIPALRALHQVQTRAFSATTTETAALGAPPWGLPDLAAAIISSSFFLRASSSLSAY